MNKKITLFVSPDGDDGLSGRYPDKIGTTDGSFQTIQRALEEIRTIPNGCDVQILLRDGTYKIHSGIVLSSDLCLDRRVTIKNCCGEKPVISSGYPLLEWTKTSEYPLGMPECCKGKVYQHTIPLINGKAPNIKTLFQGKKWLKRCSSKGFVPEDNSEFDKRWHSLKVPKGVINDYSLLSNAEVRIRPSFQWALNFLEVENWEEEKQKITTKSGGTYYLQKCHNFIDNITESAWIENSPEFFTEPSCWYCDHVNSTLYFWPEKDLDNIIMPTLTEFIRIDGEEEISGICVNGVNIEGITFTHGERFRITDNVGTLQHEWECYDSPNAIIRLRDAHNCTVKNCVFEYSSNSAIRLDLNCQYNEISNNTIRFVGGSGVLLAGYGPGLKNVNRFNVVKENHIYNCGEIYWQSIGIYVWHGSDNLVSHNLIHNTGYIGIVVGGSRPFVFSTNEAVFDTCNREHLHARRDEIGSVEKWQAIDNKKSYSSETEYFIRLVNEMSAYQHVENNIVEKNEIYKCVQRMSDGNAIYVSDTCTGNYVRCNYIHDMDGMGGQQAIRTDEWLNGTIIENNVIYRCNGGGINLKHYNNDAINNYIIDVRTVHTKDLSGAEAQMFFGYFSLVCVLDSNILPDTKKIKIKNNVVVLSDSKQTYFRVGNNDGALLDDQIEKGRLDQCLLENNLYYAEERQDEYKNFVEQLNHRGLDKGCVFNNPLITIDNKKINIDSNSPILKMGIKSLDIEDVGI
jgi:parallel beta-helix repeat protein